MENQKVSGKNSIPGDAHQRCLPPRSAFVPNVLNISPTAKVPLSGVICKEGEYWTIAIDGNAIRLRDSKGLAYLACLVRHPESEFHVLDLIGGISGQTVEGDQMLAYRMEHTEGELEGAGMHVDSLGDAGEQLDDQAKRAYRSRLSNLRAELEEAKALGKVQCAEQIEKEIAALGKELSRAVGLGGRNRRAGSASERARQSVTKAVRAAIERIARQHVVLGDIFARFIRTGTFCCYKPDSSLPIRWEFAATNIEYPRPLRPGTQESPEYLNASLCIPLHTSLAPELRNVQADRVQLQHMILDLIRNAVDAPSKRSDLLSTPQNQLGD